MSSLKKRVFYFSVIKEFMKQENLEKNSLFKIFTNEKVSTRDHEVKYY